MLPDELLERLVRIEENGKHTKETVDKIDRKLDDHQDVLTRHEAEIKSHGEKIQRLERAGHLRAERVVTWAGILASCSGAIAAILVAHGAL